MKNVVPFFRACQPACSRKCGEESRPRGRRFMCDRDRDRGLLIEARLMQPVCARDEAQKTDRRRARRAFQLQEIVSVPNFLPQREEIFVLRSRHGCHKSRPIARSCRLCKAAKDAESSRIARVQVNPIAPDVKTTPQSQT